MTFIGIGTVLNITADHQKKSVYLWSCWNTPLLMLTSSDAEIHWCRLSNADADQLILIILCWYPLVEADSPTLFQPMLITHMRTLWSTLVHIIPGAAKHQPENNEQTIWSKRREKLKTTYIYPISFSQGIYKISDLKEFVDLRPSICINIHLILAFKTTATTRFILLHK